MFVEYDNFETIQVDIRGRRLKLQMCNLFCVCVCVCVCKTVQLNIFFVLLQLIPKTGRTILCLEIPTTWWEPTVCLCLLTTSEEGRY